ncbi:hypothetical protein NDU88_002689 [Pleurodeles waltl]|uniref:Uncharacterized protein n=1 Tax=Pleurodeles waltl TaxID=8319 RepID=A0AAV7PES3_PLEWA|nr:hypothetical protein NDU88_002689 [Pleurodeles waltl]
MPVCGMGKCEVRRLQSSWLRRERWRSARDEDQDFEANTTDKNEAVNIRGEAPEEEETGAGRREKHGSLRMRTREAEPGWLWEFGEVAL